MKWIKIDRDEDGIATHSALNIMYAHLPFVLLSKGASFYLNTYMLVTRDTFKCDMESAIKYATHYTHYLPIPKAPEEEVFII